MIRSASARALSVATVLSILALSDPHAEGQESAEQPLADVLSSLSRVATLYRDSALSFACDEKITGPELGANSYRFEYVYAYDRARGFKDYRTDPAARSRREVNLSAYRLPQFLRRAYSWAFIFSESVQQRHHYEFVGVDNLFGRAAVKLHFEPIPPYKENVNNWFGTAWIDRETLQLLRVEALRADQHEKMKEFERERTNASAYRSWGRRKIYLIEHVETDFSEEKNGMRFPGKAAIVMSRYVIPGRQESDSFHESQVYRVEQTYSNYRFFNVRTREEIHGIVSGTPTEHKPR